MYEQKSMVREQTAELNKGKIKLKYKSNGIEDESDFQKLDQSSLYRHQQGNGLSLYHSGHSQLKLPEQKGFLGIHEKKRNSRERGFDIHKSRRSNFRELLNNENTKLEVGSGSPVVEKTLYIDSVHTVKPPSSNSSASDMKSSTDCKGNDVGIPEKSSDTEDTHSVDSSLQDIRCLSVVDEKATTRPESLQSIDSCFQSCSNKSTLEKQMHMTNGSIEDEYLIPDSLTLMSSKVADQESYDLESQRLSCDQEKCHDLAKDSITFTNLKIAERKIDLKSRQYSGLDYQESQLKMADDRKIDSKGQQLVKFGTEENYLALVQSSTTKVANDRVIDLESQRLGKLGNQESSQSSNSQMPLALLLPKSPSESWLKRTLPTISARNSSSWSSLAARIGTSSPMASPLDPKWETIVKTSNVQHGRLRFSEVILYP